MEKYKESELPLDQDELLFEVIMTYNNSIHTATKLTPFELFYGRTLLFEKDLNYNTNHEYLQQLKEFQSKLYQSIEKKN